jgi:uncharacterized protein YjbJ (UPF0337 family)
MNWDTIEGNWKEFKGKIRSEFGKLTDDDVGRMRGKQDELVGVIQQRYGIAKDEAKRRVDKWADSLKDTLGRRTH